MKFSKVYAAALLVAAFALSGCAAAEVQAEKKPSEGVTSGEQKDATPTETPEATSQAVDDGEVLKPGDSTTGIGAVPFSNSAGKTAVFAHKLVAVEKAPAADVEQLVEKSAQLKGMDIWYLRMESHYVSGDDLAYSSLYSPFVPVTASKERAQNITLIGWDSCSTNSVPMPGTDPNVVIENCRAAVAAPAGDAPVGMAWSDADSGYDISDGAAAYFYLP